MLRVILRIVTAFAFAVSVCACAGPPAETMAAVDPLGWSPSDPVEITVDNTDTTALRTVSLLLSYNNNFGGDSLTVRVMVTSPDGEYFSEEFALYETADRKKHKDFHESAMPYRDSAVFGIEGRYTFTITPLKEIEGVRAIGIKVE